MSSPIKDADVRRSIAYLVVSLGVWGIRAVYDKVKNRSHA